MVAHLLNVILSTPRCGSSTVQRAAEVLGGSGSFLREPFNPHEREEFVPPYLRPLDMVERAKALLADPGRVLGVKHVYSPFVSVHERQLSLQVLHMLLGQPNVRVILLTRRNVSHQFISLEIAHQTRDWWSEGVQALPSNLGTVKAGGADQINEFEIKARLRKLENANELLRQVTSYSAAVVQEVIYEDLFRLPSGLVAQRFTTGHFFPSK